MPGSFEKYKENNPQGKETLLKLGFRQLKPFWPPNIRINPHVGVLRRQNEL